MSIGDPALVAFIRDTIRRDGPVPFAWFMEQALYHPAHGYYSSGRAAIGRHGDYFTNVSVGPLFGRLLLAQFVEMLRALGSPESFIIVEQGAHDGSFARDVLSAAREHEAGFFSAIEYRIVEPFPVLIERQRKALEEFRDHVSWRESLAQLEPFTGIHFSNELIDAFPVHVVRREAGTDSEWMERFVCESGEGFEFVDHPIVENRLRESVNRLPISAGTAYETEINLAAHDWIAAVSEKLIRGYVLAVDYGYVRENYYAPHRTRGTLQCRAQHAVVESPFREIGRADITAHVDWTSVAEAAESCGLTFAGFADQHHFITGLLAGPLRHEFSEAVPEALRRALQTLLHPNFLGMTFQFLALKKNVGDQALSGFRFGTSFRE